MAKKIALLLALVMMFTISCVFATETDAVVTSDEPVATEDIVETIDEVPAEEDVSILLPEEEPLPMDDPTTSGETVGTTTEEHTHVEESTSNAVVGAIIAVVIVVAIVAIVWILNKK